MKNILELFDLNNCCGCGACINVCSTDALHFSTDKYGFYRPQINELKCIFCGKCSRACPVLNDLPVNKPATVFAAINKNDKILKASASGGIFYALAEDVLAKGGCVFGASLNKQLEIKHICIERIEDLPLLQKSKYVQSFIGNSYKIALEKLKEGKIVLFSGTPCQVAAMKMVAGDTCKRLILVEVVCHGVPSQRFYNEYIADLGKRNGLILNYIFTYKRKVLNGMNKFISFSIEKNKTKVRNWPADSFNYFFMEAKNYQNICYSCKYAKPERISDLTLCDYWHWESVHRKDFPQGSTLSGICVNTEKGFLALQNVFKKLSVVPTAFDSLAAHNGCLLKPTLRPYDHEKFMNEWLVNGYEFLNNQYEKKHRIRIFKSRLLMFLPENIKQWLYRLRHGN